MSMWNSAGFIIMMLVIMAILAQVQVQAVIRAPNVCKNFIDYFTMDRVNCWHNPDVYLSPPDIVRRHGYPIERYETETEDGYLLDMYRMPKENPKGIILLEPPAFATFSGWIDKGKNDSLGFILYDAGYEIWLGNLRGTSFSRKHKSLDPSKYQFWNYTFHEMGKYDMPAQVDLIVKITGVAPGGISIAAFSLGSTVAVVYATVRPEHSGKWVNVLALMAPSTSLNHISPLSYHLSGSVENIEKLANDWELGEWFAHNNFIHNVLQICRQGPLMIICLISDLVSMGNVADELPPQWIPIKFSQNPGGVSLKTFVHYMQIVKSKRFQLYDYGRDKNVEYYQSDRPPKYPVQDVKAPLLLITADYDIVSPPEDAFNLYQELPQRAKIFGHMLIRNFSHSAFFYGTTATEKVYKPILKLFDKIYERRKTSI